MDTTIKKVNSAHSPQGPEGQTYLASGKNVSMRMWQLAPAGKPDAPHSREYETVGYMVEGRAELVLGEQRIMLEPGDSWLVPADAEHFYDVREPLMVIEATSPPARVDARDQA